jgi:hypothetical protein
MPKIKHQHSWGRKVTGTYLDLPVTAQFCDDSKCSGVLLMPKNGRKKTIGQKGRFFPR